MKKIYLAVPYSHPDSAVRVFRFQEVNKVAAKLMCEGNLVFSPISHTHPIAVAGDLPKGWNYWKDYDKSFIEWADEIYVFMLEGWKESTGVQAEIKLAEDLGKKVTYIEVQYVYKTTRIK